MTPFDSIRLLVTVAGLGCGLPGCDGVPFARVGSPLLAELRCVEPGSTQPEGFVVRDRTFLDDHCASDVADSFDFEHFSLVLFLLGRPGPGEQCYSGCSGASELITHVAPCEDDQTTTCVSARWYVPDSPVTQSCEMCVDPYDAVSVSRDRIHAAEVRFVEDTRPAPDYPDVVTGCGG